MKKTTKMAAVLAAMSVMVIGAVSTTMAANEGWNGNDNDGWTYVQDGVKVKGWQQINGVWYYFDKSGNMAQDELVTISGQTYYLSQSGAMATGWQRFESDHGIYEELEENNDFPKNYDQDERETVVDVDYLYDDEIWLYFDEHGVGVEDKWIQSDSGLWYYFDYLVMARSDYSYKIGENYYGLDENGAMMVGWVRDNEDSRNDRPTGSDDTRAWYYYQSNGKQVTGENSSKKNGNWKKIDGTWYYFVSEDYAEELSNSDPKKDVKKNAILTGIYVNIDKNDDLFYFNGDGKMATGITKVADGTIVTGTKDANAEKKISDGVDVYFNGSNGKVESGIKGDSYYIKEAKDPNTLSFKKKGEIVSGETFVGQVKGQLAKECLVKDGDDLYYVDKYGEIIKNEALEITFKETGEEYKIVFGSNGKAIRGKEAGKTVKAGKTYTVDNKKEIDIKIGEKATDKVTINVFE